jgi:hypothetical protein
MPGIEESERSGAIGRFDHARAKARLADQRRLLIAGDPGDRNCGAEQLRCRCAKIGIGIQHLGQNRARDPEGLDEIVVPAGAPDIEQHRAGGVRDIRQVPSTARKPPQEVAVDRAEGDLARSSAFAQPRQIGEQPSDLGCGKIRVDDQPGALRDNFAETFPAPALA